MACNIYIILGGCSDFFFVNTYWKGAQVLCGLQEENTYNSSSKLKGTQLFPLHNPLNLKPYHIFPILLIKSICLVFLCQCLQTFISNTHKANNILLTIQIMSTTSNSKTSSIYNCIGIQAQNTKTICKWNLYNTQKLQNKQTTLCFGISNHQKWFGITTLGIISPKKF